MRSPSLKSLARLSDNSQQMTPERCRALKAKLRDAETVQDVDAALDFANVMLEGHGVEAVRDREWEGYYADIGLLYVNAGDTYALTLIYDTRRDSWSVTTLGHVIERQPRRFA